LLVSFSAAATVSAESFSAGTTSSPGTFVKAYSNVVGSTRFALTPEDVQATRAGGYIALGSTQSASSTHPSVSWLLKLSSSGSAQWQRELGCLSTPPGDYALGSAIVPTADGGYVVGGGTVGCGSGNDCAALSGVQCALVEKVSATGGVVWARVYNAGATGSSIRKIRQTSDGGFIAAGTINGADQTPGGLILKLDGQGNVQWQRQLAPGGSTQVLFNDVQQTSDGGYVVTGELETPASSVLVVKLDSTGTVMWQRSFKGPSGPGEPTAATAYSIIQSSDGGYLVGGHWDGSPAPNACCTGALLLKLDSAGNIQWQTALSGGLYCFFNGFSETCTNLAALVYSAHQTADGGYVLTGDENLVMSDGAPIEPWIGKIDASGKLLWQHLYYQTNKSTGRPLSEYFAASAAASDGGFTSLGFTENPTTGLGELYGVKTDSSGLAGSSCGDIHPATTLNPTNPTLTAVASALPVSSTVTPASSSPATTVATSIGTQSAC
jgi:hypothetical protein